MYAHILSKEYPKLTRLLITPANLQTLPEKLHFLYWLWILWLIQDELVGDGVGVNIHVINAPFLSVQFANMLMSTV